MNAAAGLSSRDTMSFMPICFALVLLDAATKEKSQQAFLLEAGVMDALEYACAHDFPFANMGIANYGAGGAVALVGRNEGGKTLSRKGVNSIAKTLQRYFEADNMFIEAAAKSVLASLSRVVTMTISDANKRLMLQCDGLIDTLVHCLLPVSYTHLTLPTKRIV